MQRSEPPNLPLSEMPRPLCSPLPWLRLLLLLFASKVPQMIVPYADAAALMLAHLEPRDAMSRHRVGLALPVGMRGKKDTWAAKPRSAS